VAAVVAVIAAVAAVVTVGAAVVEEVVAGSPLDHGEVLELFSQPVDPEGETLHARVLVHIMMHLDVEGLANTFKLSEGAPEQLDGELSVFKELFLVSVLGRRLFPLLQLLPTAASVVVLPSSLLGQRWAARRHLLLLSVTEDL
jgi:hypothetical protein